MTGSTGIYVPDEWPGQLACADCDQPFNEGEAYASRTIPSVPGTVAELIICASCAVLNEINQHNSK